MVKRQFSYFFLTILNGLLFLMEQEVGANPTEPTVTAGQANCHSTPQKLEVTAHDRTIISWKDFSIASQETTRFNLPSSQAVVLNRVGSNMPSKIEGLLSSNGVVYLINPNGILITSSGKIDTAGFLASTLNIADQDFLNGGDLLFKGSSGTLINQGTIRCSSGDVVLMAYQITNEGTLEASQGITALGTGQEIVMALQGDERLTVRLSTPESNEEIGIHQTGTIEAMKAELKADGNLYAYAIKQEGVINAISSVEHAGRIYLVAEKGHVTNSGSLTAKGGEVRILGQRTALLGEAVIDVSSENGGGTILVGGDYQGKNPDILNAEFTFVEPNVKIYADALSLGDGGKVIFWADKMTAFHGNISAQGGPQGGDGGFVEVSGKDILQFNGLVNTLAPLGKTGTLLLDPSTFLINEASVTINGTDSNFTTSACPTIVYTPTGTNASINTVTLLTNLMMCNVTINTAFAGGAGTGVITFQSGFPLNWSMGANLLTLNADLDILVDANITITSGGSVVFNANRNIGFTAASFSQTGGNATFNAGTVQTGSFSTNATSPINFAGAGTLTITSANNGAIGLAGSLTLGGTSTLVATSTGLGSVIFSGGITSTSSGPFTAQATGSAGTGNASFTTNNVSFTGGSAVTLESTPNGGFVVLSSPTMTFSGAGGSLTATAHGGLQVLGNLNYSSTGLCQLTSAATTNAITISGNLDFAAPSGNVTISASNGTIATSGSITSASGTLTMFANIAGNALVIGGPLNLSAGAGAFSATAMTGSLSFTDGITSTATTSFMAAAPAGAIATIGGTAVSFTGGSAVTLTTAGVSGGAITLGSPMTFSGAGGSLTVDAQLAIGLNNTFSYSCDGTCSLTSEAAAGGFGNTSTTTFSGMGDITITTGGQFETHGAIINSSSGTFIVNNTAGNVFIEAPITFNSPAGNLTFHGGGLFDIENLITNNSTASFTLTGTGEMQLIGASAAIVFNPGAGPLMINVAGSIEFFGPVTNMSSNDFTIIGGAEIDSSTAGIFTFGPNPGSLSITAGEIDMGGAMNFGTGAGTLTLNATSGLVTAGTITYNTNASPMTLHNTNGTMLISGPIALNSTAALNMTTTTGNISVQNLIRNILTGPINVTSGANLFVGSSTTTVPSQIGTAGATVTISTVGDVQVIGGSGATSYAQIGFDTGTVNSNLTFTNIGGNLRLAGGTGNNSYALIGHGSATGTGGSLTGNILFTSIGGNANVQPPLDEVAPVSASLAQGFAQIGHLRAPTGTNPVTATGNITLTTMMTGSISVVGMTGTNSYALIGHGGGLSDQPDSYTGNIALTSAANVTVATRNGLANSFGAIGHSALMSGSGTVTVHPSSLTVTAANSILVQSQPGNIAIIGPYVNTLGGAGAGAINLTTFNVTATSGNLSLSTIAPPAAPLNGAVVGPLTFTGVLPLAAAGNASSPLVINVGSDLQLQTGYSQGSGSSFTLIQNGMGAGGGSTDITVAGKTTLLGGNNIASIGSVGGALTLDTSGSLTLIGQPQTGSLGNAQITGNGATTITASAVSLTGFIGGPAALIQNSTGFLHITSMTDPITLTNNANISLTGGAGTLNVVSPTDLLLNGAASISSLSSALTTITVPVMASLLAGVSNTSITSAGPLTLNVTNNLNLVSNAGGSAFITAGGDLNITAQNMSLSGIGAGQQSYIQETAGNMLVITQNDISLADNALVQNTGAGTLTLVVDNQNMVSTGAGRFLLDPAATVIATGALRIFTSQPNGVAAGNLAFGLINGVSSVAAGLACAFDPPPASTTNQYNTFFSTFITDALGFPYTIYYKQAAP